MCTCTCERFPGSGDHVLLAMSHSGSVDSETDEPGPDANTRHVYCAVLDRVLPGTEALHHLQSGVPGGRVSDLQQRVGKLHLLEQLRRPPVREWLRPRPCYGGDDGAGDERPGEGRGIVYARGSLALFFPTHYLLYHMFCVLAFGGGGSPWLPLEGFGFWGTC